MALDDKYVGLILAVISSVLIGISFIITKMALTESTKSNGGGAGDNYKYLRSYTWWIGTVTMALGEAANFAAYSYAPAILVTPLGAGSVLISAVLAQIFLKEQLGKEGIIGCALCILGAVLIILHSPEEKKVESVDEILAFVIQPAFLIYMIIVAGATLFLIYRVAPKYGKRSMLVYLSICSMVGSISVMAAKGFGIALKLTFSGHNQLVYPSTYVFGIVVVVCAVTQINYFNKALDMFSTNRVTPIYFVMFTTATIIASVILFQGFNEALPINVVTVFCGFITIFIGVFLLNESKQREASLTPLSLTAIGTSGGMGPGSASPGAILLEKGRRNGSANGVRPGVVSETHLLRTFQEFGESEEDMDD
ncbi:magnesium transporter [Cladochytrium replicatum]|nr:magnesium transporter [Cladochytrium replicatum]